MRSYSKKLVYGANEGVFSINSNDLGIDIKTTGAFVVADLPLLSGPS